MKFEDLEFVPHTGDRNGIAATAYFANGRGASVIRHKKSWGHEEGLYELAVVRGAADGASKLDMSTPITDDVIGWLTPDDVTALLNRIAELPAVERED